MAMQQSRNYQEAKWAIQNRDPDTVRKVLKQSTFNKAQKKDLLTQAVTAKDSTLKVVANILPEDSYDWYKALHKACYNGDANIIKRLITNQYVSPDKNDLYKNMIVRAAQGGNSKLAWHLFYTAGADPALLNSQVVGAFIESGLTSHVQSIFKLNTNLLLDKPAEEAIAKYETPDVLRWAKEYNIEVRNIENIIRTALINNNFSTLDQVLEIEGHNINTAKWIKKLIKEFEGKLDAIQYLLEKDDCANHILNQLSFGYRNDGPLIYAAREEYTELGKLLLNYGADPEKRSSYALVEAVFNDDADLAHALLNHGANLYDARGDTLHYEHIKKRANGRGGCPEQFQELINKFHDPAEYSTLKL